MALICTNFTDDKLSCLNLTAFVSMLQEIIIFLQIISQENQNISTMTTPDKLKELEDIVINFNEYLNTVSAGLEQLEISAQAIVDNLQTEINELSTRTSDIIRDMKKDLEQGRMVLDEMLKSISSLKSHSSTISTISTISPVKPQFLQTTKSKAPSSSIPFLEKERKMQELKAKLLAKRTVT